MGAPVIPMVRHQMQKTVLNRNSDKQFTCHIIACGKSYARKEDLIAHVHSHDGSQPFACPEPGCLKRFRRKDDCRKHVARKHERRRDFVCGGPKDQVGCCNCGREFATKFELKRHHSQSMKTKGEVFSAPQRSLAVELISNLPANLAQMLPEQALSDLAASSQTVEEPCNASRGTPTTQEAKTLDTESGAPQSIGYVERGPLSTSADRQGAVPLQVSRPQEGAECADRSESECDHCSICEALIFTNEPIVYCKPATYVSFWNRDGWKCGLDGCLQHFLSSDGVYGHQLFSHDQPLVALRNLLHVEKEIETRCCPRCPQANMSAWELLEDFLGCVKEIAKEVNQEFRHRDPLDPFALIGTDFIDIENLKSEFIEHMRQISSRSISKLRTELREMKETVVMRLLNNAIEKARKWEYTAGLECLHGMQQKAELLLASQEKRLQERIELRANMKNPRLYGGL